MSRSRAVEQSLARALVVAWAAAGCGGGSAGVPDAGAGADGTADTAARADQAPAPNDAPSGPGDRLAPPPDGGAPPADRIMPAPPADGPGPALDTAGSAPDVAGGADAPVRACGVCTSYGTPELLGRIADAQLNAVSGIAASWRNRGVLYVHNDRNRAELAAISEAGAVLGRLTLMPAPAARDFESVEVGPCPGGTCLYFADIGNNIAPIRSELVIYRVAEPAVVPGQAPASQGVAYERFAFSYPDGMHNAEAILIDPATSAVYVVTKEAAGARSAAYRVPLDAARATTAVKVADLPVPGMGDQPATGGSAHPCGGGFLLRTNNTLYEFRIAAGTPFEQAFRATPVMVPVGSEVQGEGVAYAADGRGYYTTSEGAMPPVHRVICR